MRVIKIFWISILIAIIIYGFDIRFLRKQLDQIKENIILHEKELKKQNIILNNSINSESQLNLLETEYQTVSDSLLNQFDISILIDSIQKLAFNQGLQIEKLQSLDAQPQQGFLKHVIEIIVSGKKSRAIAFLFKLSQLPGCIDFENVDLTSLASDEKESVKLNLVLALYSNDDANNPSGVLENLDDLMNASETSITDKNSSKLKTENSLQHFSIYQMKYQGFISDKIKKYALLKAPNNKIYPVTVSDIVGDEKAKVIAIEPLKLVLQINNQKYEMGSDPR